jgi:putative tricarboxylic transport membrane protein
LSWEFITSQFVAQFGLWWVIVPGILLGIVVGILPGFSPQNTLIMLLPLTLAIPVEQAFAFMVALYCANHLAGGVPAILVKIPGSGGAVETERERSASRA